MNDSDKPIVQLLHGGATKDERAELMRKIEAGWADECKVAAMMAKLKKMQFDAYLVAGFSAAQALELVK